MFQTHIPLIFLSLITTLFAFGCVNEKGEAGEEAPRSGIIQSPTNSPTPTLPLRTEKLSRGHPVIEDIDFPETVPSGSPGGLGTVRFSDSAGDIHSAQFTALESGCLDFEYFAFDPMTSLTSGDRFAGSFQFRQKCELCPENQQNTIRMLLQLFDREGNESSGTEYEFLCE